MALLGPHVCGPVVFYVVKVIHKIMVGQLLTHPKGQAAVMQSVSLSEPYVSWLLELAEAHETTPEDCLATLVLGFSCKLQQLPFQPPESLSAEWPEQ